MKIQVTVDGKTSDVNVEFDNLTLQESVRMESVLGSDGYDRFLADTEAGNPFKRPSTMRALIFSKVVGKYPNVSIDDFDIDMGSLMDEEPDSGNDSDNE